MAHITSPGPAEAARKLLREVAGATPAMGDVPTKLRERRIAELQLAAEIDALVILCRARGMTWEAIAGLLGQSAGAARGRARRSQLAGGG